MHCRSRAVVLACLAGGALVPACGDGYGEANQDVLAPETDGATAGGEDASASDGGDRPDPADAEVPLGNCKRFTDSFDKVPWAASPTWAMGSPVVEGEGEFVLVASTRSAPSAARFRIRRGSGTSRLEQSVTTSPDCTFRLESWINVASTGLNTSLPIVQVRTALGITIEVAIVDTKLRLTSSSGTVSVETAIQRTLWTRVVVDYAPSTGDVGLSVGIAPRVGGKIMASAPTQVAIGLISGGGGGGGGGPNDRGELSFDDVSVTY